MSTTKVAQSNIWAEITGVSGTWATITGGGLSTPATKTRDGGAPDVETLIGLPTYADLALSRPYDSARDQDAERQLDTLVRRGQEVVVTRYVGTPDGVVLGRRTYIGRITGMTPPDADAMAGTPSNLSITISVDRAA